MHQSVPDEGMQVVIQWPDFLPSSVHLLREGVAVAVAVVIIGHRHLRGVIESVEDGGIVQQRNVLGEMRRDLSAWIN